MEFGLQLLDQKKTFYQKSSFEQQPLLPHFLSPPQGWDWI
jgi:hypothetical protein